jgi:hypothetical protein
LFHSFLPRHFECGILSATASGGEETASEIETARDVLIATYRAALRASDSASSLEKYALRHAVAQSSAAAARQLATRWSAEQSEPMARLARDAKMDDLVGKARVGPSLIIGHVGLLKIVALVPLSLVLWFISLTPRSFIGRALWLLAFFWAVALFWRIGDALRQFGKTLGQLDHRVRQSLEPAQGDFFRVVGGSPPMIAPVKVSQFALVGTAYVAYGFILILLLGMCILAET